jgi:hypothetical protein
MMHLHVTESTFLNNRFGSRIEKRCYPEGNVSQTVQRFYRRTKEIDGARGVLSEFGGKMLP